MDVFKRIGWIGFIAVTRAVSSDGGTQQFGAKVGAVTGPNGSKLVIPARALVTDTTINIAPVQRYCRADFPLQVKSSSTARSSPLARHSRAAPPSSRLRASIREW
jgi:hypothetical protein